MAQFDPTKQNWSGITPIEVADDLTLKGHNFSQFAPWTEPFSASGLIFEDCNLTNCVLPADCIVKHSGRVIAYPSLANGKKHDTQRRWLISSKQVEAEPGIFEGWDVEQSVRVTGSPESSVNGEVISERRLGLTGV